MKNWFERFFSLDELRVSALVICMIAVVATCIISFFMYGEINSSILSLADSLIYTVGGVTVGVSAISGYISAKNNIIETEVIDNVAQESNKSNSDEQASI